MNITLEMIEQVIDATGADYYEVKQTLLEQEGDVEAAIEAINKKTVSEFNDTAEPFSEDADVEAADSQEDAADEELGTDDENHKKEDPFKDFFSDEYADKMVDRLKEKVKAGNVDRIRISRDDKTIIDVPVNVGMIGGLLGFMMIPWAMIFGIITAYGLNCKIEIISSDGKSEDL